MLIHFQMLAQYNTLANYKLYEVCAQISDAERKRTRLAFFKSIHGTLNHLKDMQRTGDRTDVGLFGINQHWGYDLPQNNIEEASAGCLLGRTREGHREFMQLIKGDERFKRDHRFIFTTTVIAGDDLVKR